MKLLAKSILVPAQIDARKNLGTDGVEVLLLGRDLYDGSTFNPEKAKATEEKLTAIAQDSAFGTLSLEFADSVDRFGIQPVSDNEEVRAFSRDLLSRVVAMANRVNAAAPGKVGYFQYQLIFEPFDEHGYAPAVSRQNLLDDLALYHEHLQRASDVPLQIENGIRINPAYSNGTPTESVITTTIEDNLAMNVPLALDTAHYAQILMVYADAQHEGTNVYSIVAPSKRAPNGERFYIQLTQAEEEMRERIRANPDRKDAITSELERAIRNHPHIIGSMQFADTEAGQYGVDERGAGYNGPNGVIDIPRLLKTAVEADIPFVIPEYKETDYANVPNQRAGIAMVREAQRK